MLMRFICTDDSLLKGPNQLAIGGTYQIGRSSKCAFVLGERSVSRVHAEVEVRHNHFFVKDLQSRNGTFVNGERIETAELNPGCKVHFGMTVFHLVNGEMPSELDEEALSHASTFIVHDKKPTAAKRLAQLSQGEMRVLDLLKKGHSEKQAAVRLKLSPHTVHNHTKAIYRKFDVNSRAELLALFMADDSPK